MNIKFFHHKGEWLTRDDVIKSVGREKFGKDPKQTLQFYEKEGLIPKAVRKRGRNGGVYSCYRPEVVNILSHIKSLQAEGYLLCEIKEMLDAKDMKATMPNEFVGTPLMVRLNESRETKAPDIIELTDEQMMKFIRADGAFNNFVYDLIKKKYAESLTETLSILVPDKEELASSGDDASQSK